MASDNRQYCSPIRDQANCGSCTAFGSVGAWEEAYKKATGLTIDLSEKDLFSCSGGRCSEGNTVEATLNRAMVGVCLESCDPYNGMADGVDSDCGEDRCPNPVEYKLMSWKVLTGIGDMKAELQSGGSLVAVMDVHESFLHYISGVYHSLGVMDQVVGGHCITIVGFNDNKKAWLLRNSWGTGWGEQGYCWILYGDSNIDKMMYHIVPDLKRIQVGKEEKGLSKEKDRKYLSFVGFLISGMTITIVGLYAASGGLGDTWEIMGRTILSTEWGLPFAILGIILLLIGAILAYSYFKKK